MFKTLAILLLTLSLSGISAGTALAKEGKHTKQKKEKSKKPTKKEDFKKLERRDPVM